MSIATTPIYSYAIDWSTNGIRYHSELVPRLRGAATRPVPKTRVGVAMLALPIRSRSNYVPSTKARLACKTSIDAKTPLLAPSSNFHHNYIPRSYPFLLEVRNASLRVDH